MSYEPPPAPKRNEAVEYVPFEPVKVPRDSEGFVVAFGLEQQEEYLDFYKRYFDLSFVTKPPRTHPFSTSQHTPHTPEPNSQVTGVPRGDIKLNYYGHSGLVSWQ